LPITTEISSDGLPRDVRFGPDVEAAAYFFISEALGNILKHAKARRAWICLQSAVDRLSVEVRDDGCGFAIESVNLFGLHGLCDRIEALGGRMKIASSTEHGTTVSAWLPTKEQAHG